jgi:hypothetical protein
MIKMKILIDSNSLEVLQTAIANREANAPENIRILVAGIG